METQLNVDNIIGILIVWNVMLTVFLIISLVGLFIAFATDLDEKFGRERIAKPRRRKVEIQPKGRKK